MALTLKTERILLLPGLNRMIARRQPSSVLSILMSRILDTSSVSTLERDLQVTQRSQPASLGLGPVYCPTPTTCRSA